MVPSDTCMVCGSDNIHCVIIGIRILADFENKAQDVHDEAKSPGTWKKSWDKMDR